MDRFDWMNESAGRKVEIKKYRKHFLEKARWIDAR
jgi:hypothetical protein